MASTSAASDDTYVKADSRNLPAVQMVMVLEYMAVSDNHNVAEIRGAKALISSRDSYVNSAVGYVELKTGTGMCRVRAKVVPEHRISSKLYNVAATLDEIENTITEVTCEDCAAAAGGCKHSLLLLFWLVKRSSEASSTSIECYWTRPKLASARTEHVQAKAIFKNAKRLRLCTKNPQLLTDFHGECERRSIKDSLIRMFHKKNDEEVNIFDLTLRFVEEETSHNFENFFEYANKIIADLKQTVQEKTLEQANNKYWHYVRQGRLTASKLYEAAHCKKDGSLVQQILGGYKVPDTIAIKRGKRLEKAVIKELEKKIKMKVGKSGFMLINSILGASPDGITDDYVVEVKCPMTKKTFKNYVSNGKVTSKYEAQINCQMIAANKGKGIFCVADPSFEDNKVIYIYWMKYNKVLMDDLIENATNFWKLFIFPKIIKSAKE